MIPSCSFRRLATGSGRTLSSSPSDLACSSLSAASACSRARTKYSSSAKTVVVTPTKFMTNSTTTTTPGRSGARANKTGSTAPENVTSPTTPINHGTACRAPTNRSAPSGAVIAHSATAEPVLKPPRLSTAARTAAAGSSRAGCVGTIGSGVSARMYRCWPPTQADRRTESLRRPKGQGPHMSRPRRTTSSPSAWKTRQAPPRGHEAARSPTAIRRSPTVV